MSLITICVFIIAITILSVIVFGVKGLFSLCVIIPLAIIYLKSNDIIEIFRKRKRERENMDKVNLSEGKEVEVVSSRNRKKGVNGKKKLNISKLFKFKKKETTTSKRNSSKSKTRTKTKDTRSRDGGSPKKKKSILRKILTVFLSLCIFGVFAMMAFMIYIVVSTGDFNPEALKNQDQTVVYDKDGNVFATLGDEKRESVDFDQLPQVLIDALIATEDSRFYEHNGVDMARFLKATLLNLVGKDDAGGASTLTMQTVKNNLTKKDSLETNKIKKIVRKFQDVYLSVFFMEKKYSKSEILVMSCTMMLIGFMNSPDYLKINMRKKEI